MHNENKNRRVPGSDPERLKLHGDWKDAVKRALHRKKPPEDESPEGADDQSGRERPMDDDT